MREQAYKNLSSKLRGSLITPADGEYEVARRVYNGMIDRRPEAIVRCADVADIMTAVNFARKEDVLVAVRGGGGNFGIVTSFRFQGRPVAPVFAGPMLWEMEHARELLQWYREISPVLPEELYGFFAFLKVPPALQSMFDAIYPPGLQWYKRRKDYGLDEGLLGGAASFKPRRCIRKLYDGGRNRSGQSDRPGELRSSAES
jgi:hypothetical protein